VIGSECARNYVNVDLIEAWERNIAREQRADTEEYERQQARARWEARQQARHAGVTSVPEQQALGDALAASSEAERAAEMTAEDAIAQVRAAFAQAHPDVDAFLTSVQDSDPTPFLRSVRDQYISRGTISERQILVVTRIQRERAEAAANPAAEVELTGATQPVREAGRDDARHILNGIYTINDGDEHLTYRIHTVQRGSLEGKRIVKRQTAYGEFEGFGFLRSDGTLQVWRRFREAADRGERYVEWASILLNALSLAGPDWHSDRMYAVTAPSLAPLAVQRIDLNRMPDDSLNIRRWEIQRASTCRRCNRPITTPSSLDAGLGPECAERDADRTTAANPRRVARFDVDPDGEPLQVRILPPEDGFENPTPAPTIRSRRPARPRTIPTRQPAAAPQVRMSQVDPTWEQ
jgi:hypothetical protein